MSGIGGWEVLILIMIGLVVLGPKRLPQVANQLGSWIGQARRMTRAMKRQLEDELDLDEQFRPKTPRIAPPVVPEDVPDPADPAYDYDTEAGAAPEAEAYIPGDDDTYSPLHDEEADSEDEDEQEKNT